jgi:hypothetical protein
MCLYVPIWSNSLSHDSRITIHDAFVLNIRPDSVKIWTRSVKLWTKNARLWLTFVQNQSKNWQFWSVFSNPKSELQRLNRDTIQRRAPAAIYDSF